MKTLKLIAAVCAVALASLGVSTAVASTNTRVHPLGFQDNQTSSGGKVTCADDGNGGQVPYFQTFIHDSDSSNTVVGRLYIDGTLAFTLSSFTLAQDTYYPWNVLLLSAHSYSTAYAKFTMDGGEVFRHDFKDSFAC